MNTQVDKQGLIEWIANLKDPATLESIQSLKTANESETDFWPELPVDVKKAINKAKKELDEGKGIPHNKVMAEIHNRFST